MDCNCPENESLLEIIAENCGVDLKQIQRVAFQRTQATASFTPTTILTLSVWQALLAATDETKIVITPLIGGDPVIEPGEAITTGGGDNSTLNGIEQLEGVNPSKFSCVFKSLSALVETQIKALKCETTLTVYLILQGGRIACATVGLTAYGFTIQSFFLSDRGNAGFGTKDTFKCSFSLQEGWSENLAIYKPTWNPLISL